MYDLAIKKKKRSQKEIQEIVDLLMQLQKAERDIFN